MATDHNASGAMPVEQKADEFSASAYPGYGYPRTMDAELARLLAAQAAASPPVDRYALPFPEARARLIAERRRSQTGLPAMHSIDEASMQVDGRRVGMRWYRAQPGDGRAPIVYLHGGGWCVGANDTHDTLLRHLAAASGLPVCGVDYALAPEHPFPAALHDLRGVLDAVQAMPEFEGRPPMLAGDSAGANLALLEAMRRRDAGEPLPAALLLFYGVFAPMRDAGSCAAFGNGDFGLSRVAQQRYVDAYLTPATPEDARVYPLLGALHGLPPTYVMAAGLDMLLDDSVHLHHAIAAAGGASTLRVWRGVTHGFLNLANQLPAAAQALREAGAYVQAVVPHTDAVRAGTRS